MDINKKPLMEPRKFVADIKKIIDIWKREDGGDDNEFITLVEVLFQCNLNFRFFYLTYMYANYGRNDCEIDFVKELLKLFALLSIKEYGYSLAKFKPFLIGLNTEISKGNNTAALVEKIHSHIEKEFSQDDIKEAVVTLNPNSDIVYLNEYLFAKEKNAVLSFDPKRVEIEHIMPSSGRIIASIREDADIKDEAEFHNCVNKIGNKILLEQSINRAISRNWFKDKKQKSIRDKRGYKDSIFPIAQSLVSYKKDTWEKADIDKATQKAAERIVRFIFE